MFVMNTSALCLLISVALLNVHHHNPDSAPPYWLQSITFSVVSKLFCVSVPAAVKWERRSSFANRNRGSFTDKHNDISDNTKLQGQGQHEGEGHDPGELWIVIARMYDKVFLRIFVVINLVGFAVLMYHCPQAIHDHPKHLPRVKMLWNVTELDHL